MLHIAMSLVVSHSDTRFVVGLINIPNFPVYQEDANALFPAFTLAIVEKDPLFR